MKSKQCYEHHINCNGNTCNFDLDLGASWVIRNKLTGEVIMETFDPKKVAALNTAKYEAVPALDYLVSLNGAT